ncbi:hypothetical protein [Microbacterium sp. MYb64]|uniref:hypothetical protein n=1 Tax=Microbacterium sp. MYb64 TaxID=1848691 RepID=UPI000CFE14CE|nr:hypothetical protein [Microbacterium sp. MYb64]PRB07006.1 hypothetical protein CQ044_07980 [Microbacterium sp. MYb64]
MKKFGLGKKLLLAGALSGALVLGTVVPANAYAVTSMGPYSTYAKCKAAERTYNSSWTKVHRSCFPFRGGWWFDYRTPWGS